MDACSATKSTNSDMCSPKTVAVVIPVYARTIRDIGLLQNALQALAAQDRRPDFVVVVDDAGPVSVQQQEDQPAFIVRRSLLAAVASVQTYIGPQAAQLVPDWCVQWACFTHV